MTLFYEALRVIFERQSARMKIPIVGRISKEILRRFMGSDRKVFWQFNGGCLFDSLPPLTGQMTSSMGFEAC